MKPYSPSIRWIVLLLLLTLLAAVTVGCKKAELPDGAAVNEILTFADNRANKPVVRIGTQYYTPNTNLVDALNEHFTDYLFILDYGAAAGVNSEDRIYDALNEGAHYDMLITGSLNGLTDYKRDLLVDLSAEAFLGDYLLSALNDVSIDGHIYSIPGTSTLSGIAFNVDMFNAHGWEAPKTHEEFFALCETIRETGVAPFSTNFKYMNQLNRLLTMMCYSELFGPIEGTIWLNKLQRNEADYEGTIEPLYELAKRFADTGVITLDDFTASLTKQRQAFWAGEYAMIDYDSAIFSYAESEQAPFELGIMPYPAVNADDAGFAVSPEYYISIPKCVESDPDRRALMMEVLTFISSEAGQQAMLANSLRISNVKGADLGDNPATKYAEEAYEKGNLYPVVLYRLARPGIPFLTLQQTAVQSLFEGASVADAIRALDASLDEAFAEEIPVETYETLATAEADFSMLETSYYLADKLREASGADIGLMIDRGFFRSNLASFDEGEISSNLQRFVMKGVGAEDYLTTYSMTGAQIRQLLEHPVINGAETDVLIAASGLAIEYAPWNERGSRVIKLTKEDGAALDDDALYTVAAWAGVIDEAYITETLQAYDSLGTLTDILADALVKDGTIRPDIAGRVTLVWPAADAA